MLQLYRYPRKFFFPSLLGAAEKMVSLNFPNWIQKWNLSWLFSDENVRKVFLNRMVRG